MTFYSVGAGMAVVAALLLLISTPIFRFADNPPTNAKHRNARIDGLRGLLATAVFLHHAVIYHDYLVNGVWKLPPSRVYSMLGQVGVAMFFMVTGYLFWGKALNEKGRIRLGAMYLGRLFRILPLYWTALFLVGLGAIAHTGPHFMVSKLEFLRTTTEDLAGGFFWLQPINGFARTTLLSAGVFWSLHYEWLFYGSLLFTSHLARSRVLGRMFPIVAAIGSAIWVIVGSHPEVTSPPPVCALLFCLGMTAAVLRDMIPKVPLAPLSLSAIAIASIILVFLVATNANTVIPVLLLGLAFDCIVIGADGFRLLLSTGARRLGDASYGIYLLQGPVLAITFALRNVRIFALASPWTYWLVVLVAGVALVVSSCIAHVAIERPFVKIGARAVKLLARKPPPS